MIKKTLGILFFTLFFPLSQLSAAVVINEIYPKEEGNEWIELFNNGSESVSLDRWSLENSNGNVKKFSFNASANIAANGFLIIPQSESGISLSNDGDSVRLLDSNNNQIDRQSYPGILGFNTSMGRSSDGGGSWVNCTVATVGKPNSCPPPTPTTTPLPTPIPTATIAPTLEPSPTTIPTLIPQILAATIVPTAIPIPSITPFSTPPTNTLRSLGWVVMGIGIVWGCITLIALTHHLIKNRKK